MKKIIAFAGSNSSNSINKKLVELAAKQMVGFNCEVLDLNDYKLPVYSIDIENKEGIPETAHEFLEKIKNADGIILSLAEHNGAYSTAFKNIFDWMSRIDGKLWNNVPMLLMATSPGKRGGQSVLEIAQNRFPRMGGNISATFSLPSFNTNYTEKGLQDEALQEEFLKAIHTFKTNL